MNEFIKTDLKIFKSRRDQTNILQSKKVTIVGYSEVGMAIALSVITRGLVQSLCYIDLDKTKITNEIHDLKNAGYTMERSTEILCGSDFSLSKNSDICVITITHKHSELYDEDFSECYPSMEKYIQLFKTYIPPIIEYNPNTILLVVSKPNSILTYVAWRISNLPKQRVFGIGTLIETAKLKHHLGQEWNVEPFLIRAYILGKRYRGIPIIETSNGILLNHCNQIVAQLYEKHIKIYKTINDRMCVEKNCDFVEPLWGLALSCFRIMRAVLYDTNEEFCLCSYAKDVFHIDKEVFLSMPVILNCYGVDKILLPKIRSEQKLFLREIANDCHDIHINLVLLKEI